MNDPDELVPVFLPEDFLQADAIRQELLSRDIFCHLEGENLAGLSGAGPFGNTGRWRMRLLVKARDFETAKAIIAQGQWPRYT
jgi:Putative prokaryotic signal transducing protein